MTVVRALPVCLSFALWACAPRSAAPTRDTESVTLAAALADTVGRHRVYRAEEVARPVRTRPGSAMPLPGADIGRAEVHFVVDTLGRVELSTVGVVPRSHPALVRAVRSALPDSRFWPARLADGRAVRQLVELTLVSEERGGIIVAHTRLHTDPAPPP